MAKPKVLWLSDSPLLPTGFATISSHLLNYLTELGYDCSYLAHTYPGSNIPKGFTFEDGRKLNFRVLAQGKEAYCKDLIMPYIREIQPDIFGILLDTFMLYPWAATELNYAPAKSLFYYPSDGEPDLPQNCLMILQKMNRAVAMSRFAQRQVERNYGWKTDYIPHAIETKHYYRFDEDKRKELRKKWGLNENNFVVGVVARNQGRKMLDRTIKSFALFSKDHPDAKLLMHTDAWDVAGYCDLPVLIKRFKLENRVIFTGMRYFRGFNYAQMNEVYNLMDCFLLTTSGEGFGIPIIEAQACGVPPLVTDATTTRELLCEDDASGLLLEKREDWAGLPIKVYQELSGAWNVERAISDDYDTADKLKMLYDNESLRKRLGENGIRKVRKYYDWNVVINQWDKLFQEMINK